MEQTTGLSDAISAAGALVTAGLAESDVSLLTDAGDPHVVTAVEAGDVRAEQASAIVRALELLPDDLGTEVLAACEASLIEVAATLDPGELCPRHHRRVEPSRDGPWDQDDPDRWQVRPGPDGNPYFIPPRGHDPDRTPTRHTRFSHP